MGVKPECGRGYCLHHSAPGLLSFEATKDQGRCSEGPYECKAVDTAGNLEFVFQVFRSGFYFFLLHGGVTGGATATSEGSGPAADHMSSHSPALQDHFGAHSRTLQIKMERAKRKKKNETGKEGGEKWRTEMLEY